MHDNVTELTNPEQPDEEPRKFAFDYSYWSHDCYEEQTDGYLAPTDPHYADQVCYDLFNLIDLIPFKFIISH